MLVNSMIGNLRTKNRKQKYGGTLMSVSFADNEIKKILEARGENYFDKFKRI